MSALVTRRPGTDPSYQPGRRDIRTAFVLAAPGRFEREEDRPAARQTGTNLDGVLQHLHAAEPELFPSLSRLDYFIVNAVATVLHRKLTGRSMPRASEVLEPANVARVARALDGIDTVVALSDAAVLAVHAADREPTFAHIHPGMQALNTRYRGVTGDRPTRVLTRYGLFARDLLASRSG